MGEVECCSHFHFMYISSFTIFVREISFKKILRHSFKTINKRANKQNKINTGHKKKMQKMMYFDSDISHYKTIQM